MLPLASVAGRDSVENIFVFIADSLRYDALPERAADAGVTAKTISSSTYTATSIPSMMTGRYPSKHRVWNFESVLSEPPELFSRPNAGMDLSSVWVDIEDPARKPPNRVLRLDEECRLDSAEEPFTIVFHEKGAHAPYDFFNVPWDNSPEYFEHYADDYEELRNQYAKGAKTAADRFLSIVDDLKDSGLYDDTLVVFTSDHGELLGEPERGGVYAHGSPVCPELVTVPTLFMGAGLPAGETVDQLLGGVDLAPTLMGAQGRSLSSPVDGRDLWNEKPPDDRVLRSEFWANTGRVKYGASSAWDRNGGVVHHHGSAGERLTFALHRKLFKGAQASANRPRSLAPFIDLLRTYGKREITYGSPDVVRARQNLVPVFSLGTDETTVEPVPEERLEALGYVE